MYTLFKQTISHSDVLPHLAYFGYKIEFLILKSVFFLNQNKNYTSYQKMWKYKFVELLGSNPGAVESVFFPPERFQILLIWI